MTAGSITGPLPLHKGVPAILLLALTVLIFIIASKIDDGWMIKAVMGISLLLSASLLPRLRQEERNRLQTMRFNTALSVSRMALWVHDFNKGTIEWTDSIDGVVGGEAGKFPRSIAGWLALIHPEDLPHVRSALEASRLNGTQYQVEYRLQNQAGAFIWINERGDVPVKGERAGMMHGALRDVTEQKQAADKSIQLVAQLRQAQKSEAIGTLVGGIAHDFNNLLTGIIGNAELVLMDMRTNGDGEHYRPFVETIKRAGARASALVRQILAFSRQSEKSMGPISIAPMITEVMELMRATVPANIELDCSLAPSTPQIMGDATQIHQVLVNLCTNGVHAMKGTNGRLDVTLDTKEADLDFLEIHPELLPGAQVHLRVADTGHGMDPETLKHIFEPYFTTKGPSEGTGIGLAIVQGIVKDHGGGVYCTSHAGQGTTFDVFIPACTRLAESEHDRPSPPDPATHHERILVVDDEADMLATTATMLSRLGYIVHAVSGGDAAVKAFQADPDGFDMVLTDMAMKNGTGLELAQRLLRIRSRTPVALMTGYAGNLTEKSLRKIGVSGLVMKPFTVEQLGTAVRRIIDEPANVEQAG